MASPAKKKTKAKPKPKRQRRSAEEAHTAILDATEKRMLALGPAGIRLQEIAEDIGISHPAILHHFGSREGLVRAVVDRGLLSLQTDLVHAFQSAEGTGPDGAELLERVASTLSKDGHGRFVAWLILSGYDDKLDMKVVRTNWTTINEAMHALRFAVVTGESSSLASDAQKKKWTEPDFEDTVFTVMLSALAIFGQSIAGALMFRMAGIEGGEAAGKRFRVWLAGVLSEHLAPGQTPPATTSDRS